MSSPSNLTTQFHSVAIRDSYSLSKKEAIMRAKISRGLRSLPTKTDISTQEEYDRMLKETADIEQWWSNTHRWGHTKRPFTGELHECERAVSAHYGSLTCPISTSQGRCLPSSIPRSSRGPISFAQDLVRFSSSRQVVQPPSKFAESRGLQPHLWCT